MSTPATPALTLEQRIEQASLEAAQIATQFSPVVGTAIQAGAALEPVVSGFLKMLVGIFKHHTSQPPVMAPPAAPAGESLEDAIRRAQLGAKK